MTTHTDTNAFGRALGSSAAHTEHFVRVAASFVVRETGKTGRGIAVGYATTAAQRSNERDVKAALRLAAMQPASQIAVQTA